MRFFSFFVVASALLVGCGDDPPPPGWTLRVRSQEVVIAAVQSLQIVIDPRDISDRFAEQPSQTFEGGAVETSVSMAGEFVINIAGTWVEQRSRGVNPGMGFAFALDVPMYAADTSMSQSDIMDPELRAYFIRNGDYIAQGQVFAPWPLPPGVTTQVIVTCQRPDFGHCTNNDFPPGDDGGVPDVDAGTTDTDAGGPPPTDAGPPAMDAGPPATDAGPTSADGG